MITRAGLIFAIRHFSSYISADPLVSQTAIVNIQTNHNKLYTNHYTPHMSIHVHRLDGSSYTLDTVPDSYQTLQQQILSRLDLSETSAHHLKIIFQEQVLTPQNYTQWIFTPLPEGQFHRLWVLLNQKDHIHSSEPLRFSEQLLHKQFPVYLRLVNGSAVKETVKTVSSVFKLKHKIAEHATSLLKRAGKQLITEEEAIEGWTMLYKGVELSKIDALLLYYQIRNACVIHAYQKPKETASEQKNPRISEIRLICAQKQLDYKLDISGIDTFDLLQDTIAEISGIPRQQHLLHYLGFELTAEKYPGCLVEGGQLFLADKQRSTLNNYSSQTQWFVENAWKNHREVEESSEEYHKNRLKLRNISAVSTLKTHETTTTVVETKTINIDSKQEEQVDEAGHAKAIGEVVSHYFQEKTQILSSRNIAQVQDSEAHHTQQQAKPEAVKCTLYQQEAASQIQQQKPESSVHEEQVHQVKCTLSQVYGKAVQQELKRTHSAGDEVVKIPEKVFNQSKQESNLLQNVQSEVVENRRNQEEQEEESEDNLLRSSDGFTASQPKPEIEVAQHINDEGSQRYATGIMGSISSNLEYSKATSELKDETLDNKDLLISNLESVAPETPTEQAEDRQNYKSQTVQVAENTFQVPVESAPKAHSEADSVEQVEQAATGPQYDKSNFSRQAVEQTVGEKDIHDIDTIQQGNAHLAKEETDSHKQLSLNMNKNDNSEIHGAEGSNIIEHCKETHSAGVSAVKEEEEFDRIPTELQQREHHQETDSLEEASHKLGPDDKTPEMNQSELIEFSMIRNEPESQLEDPLVGYTTTTEQNNNYKVEESWTQELGSLPNESVVQSFVVPDGPNFDEPHIAINMAKRPLGQNVKLAESIYMPDDASPEQGGETDEEFSTNANMFKKAGTQSMQVETLKPEEKEDNIVYNSCVANPMSEIKEEQSGVAVNNALRSTIGPWHKKQVLIRKEGSDVYFTSDYLEDRTVYDFKQRLEGSHNWNADSMKLYHVKELGEEKSEAQEEEEMENQKLMSEFKIRPGTILKLVFE